MKKSYCSSKAKNAIMEKKELLERKKKPRTGIKWNGFKYFPLAVVWGGLRTIL